jgi:hypothetical protein
MTPGSPTTSSTSTAVSCVQYNGEYGNSYYWRVREVLLLVVQLCRMYNMISESPITSTVAQLYPVVQYDGEYGKSYYYADNSPLVKNRSCTGSVSLFNQY